MNYKNSGLVRLYRFIKGWLLYRDSPYCYVCGSCGEEGCCNPKQCAGGRFCMYKGFDKEGEE